ncbi:MAG: 50S ribosomal protein L11 methyltransferase [Burkholderiales bacterium]|nr:50S ribosomal protein L11 methyltransferase [Burkholderiales bacterium]
MSWKTLVITTNNVYAEPLSEALLALGALSVEILDAAAGTADEQPLYGEPGAPAQQLWQKTEVSALFEEGADVIAILRSAVDATGMPEQPGYHVDVVEEQDWVKLTQSQFDPISISRRLWIVPTWHQPPDPAAINLILDPGLAFGTGSHPTTQLCLAWLDQSLQHGETVLDYGCGSGILAIAALKLGARYVTGVDIDPHAIQASQANAVLNACDVERFFFTTDYAVTEKNPDSIAQVDIVVANILSNPLIMLAPVLAQATRGGGRIVLSGILQEQSQDVQAAYQSWFEMQATQSQDGWVLLTGVKK